MLNILQTSYLFTNNISICLVITNYTILTVVGFLIFNGLKLLNISNTSTSNNEFVVLVLFNLVFFLNLAGVPPLPGFFIKLNLLINLINYINIYLIIIIVVLNFTIFYFYIQFYKSIFTYTVTKRTKINSVFVLPSLTFLLICFNFYPIYNIIVALL